MSKHKYACCACSENFTLGTVMMTWCESYFLLVCENTSNTTVKKNVIKLYIFRALRDMCQHREKAETVRRCEVVLKNLMVLHRVTD